MRLKSLKSRKARLLNLKQNRKKLFFLNARRQGKAFNKASKLAALLCSVVLAMALLAGLSACSSTSETKDYQLIADGKLTVATSLDIPPFEYLSEGAPSGYGISVMQEIANRLGLSCEFVNVPSDSVLPSIETGGIYDVAIACLPIYAEREEEVDFTQSYYVASQAIVTLKGEYLQVEELSGKVVSAQAGSAGETYAESAVSEKILSYGDAAACFSSLREERTQAIVVDAPVAQYFIENGYSDCEILETVATCEEYGIAVSKDNRALTDAINEVLSDMEEDGTLEALRKQYFA